MRRRHGRARGCRTSGLPTARRCTTGSGADLRSFAPPAPRADTTLLARAFARYRAPFTVLDVADVGPRDVYGYDLLLLRPDLHVVWRGNHLPDVGKLVAVATGH